MAEGIGSCHFSISNGTSLQLFIVIKVSCSGPPHVPIEGLIQGPLNAEPVQKEEAVLVPFSFKLRPLVRQGIQSERDF